MTRQSIGAIAAIVALLAAFGCGLGFAKKEPAITPADIAARNRQGAEKLSLGMTRDQVLDVLGRDTVFGWNGEADLENPVRTEHLRDRSGEALEVLFFLVEGGDWDGRPANEELMPLAFTSGKLVGRGWAWLEKNVQKYGGGLH